MSPQHAQRLSRRRFLGELALVGTAGFLGLRPSRGAAEPPPETTTIRWLRSPAICVAPYYVAEELLRSEGFTEVHQFQTEAQLWTQAVLSGDVDLVLNFVGPLLVRLDAGDPLVILAGVHVGCFELFGTERVRAVRDLKGKTVSVPELGSPQHVFLASIAAHVGLDPRKDINWVIHPRAEAMQLLADGKVDAFLGFPPEPQALRAQGIGHVVVNSALDRPWSQYFCCMVYTPPGIRPEVPSGDETGATRHSESGRHLCSRARPCGPIPRRQGLHGALRLCPPGDAGAAIRQVARVRPRGYGTLLRPAPARGRLDQVEPPEDHRPEHRLALPQRAEEGAEGIEGEVPVEQGQGATRLPTADVTNVRGPSQREARAVEQAGKHHVPAILGT